ncbi:MAG: DUF2238 domain-containing protein [Verrucomicrobiota bacterium]
MHLPATGKQIRNVAIFTAIYLVAAALTTLSTRNFEFVFYLVTMLLMIAAVYVVHRRVGISNGVLWGLSLWGLLHMIGGLMPIPNDWSQNTDPGVGGVVYNWWLIPDHLKYDQIIHAYGFAITTWLCWQGLSSIANTRSDEPLRPTLGLMTICAAAGMGFGALNEIIEFIATLTLPQTNVGGYINTGWDLVYNMIGSIIAVILIYLTQGKTTAASQVENQ